MSGLVDRVDELRSVLPNEVFERASTQVSKRLVIWGGVGQSHQELHDAGGGVQRGLVYILPSPEPVACASPIIQVLTEDQLVVAPVGGHQFGAHTYIGHRIGHRSDNVVVTRARCVSPTARLRTFPRRIRGRQSCPLGWRLVPPKGWSLAPSARSHRTTGPL